MSVKKVLLPVAAAVTVMAMAPALVAQASSPATKDDCKKGGWAEYGFRNQGLCIKFVNQGLELD